MNSKKKKCIKSSSRITLPDIVIKAAYKAVNLQRKDGSLEAGHNGPWSDLDTPVRNTAHWIISFAYAYEQTGDPKFQLSTERGVSFLTSHKVRPHQATFYCRKSSEIEKCNGLIGQAWAIEALTVASRCLNDTNLTKLALHIFHMHPFDSSSGLWRMVEIDGSIIGQKKAINQHIWFAAVGTEVAQQVGDELVLSKVKCFSEQLSVNLQVDKMGWILHHVSNTNDRRYTFSRGLISSIKKFVGLYKNIRTQDANYLKVGYHSFNLYALGLINKLLPGCKVSTIEQIKRAVTLVSTEEFLNNIEDNRFCYRYNPTGIEIAYSLATLYPEDSFQRQVRWIQRQLDLCYEFDKGMMIRSDDPKTSAARMYEVIRLIKLDERWQEYHFDV